ncbi:MAG: aldo/keto reductase, partial [Actinobacteria bacterium]|nr:aldo/keto reductase [Actinomycetota bacterium]
PDQIRKACLGSLSRLGTDVIDLYQLHWLDRDGAALEDTWGAMASLVDEGLVRWIGVSNFGERTISACEAVRHVDSLQPELSLLAPGLLDLAAWCGERGIGVVPYSPLGCGLLSGAIDSSGLPENDWRSGKLWESEQYEELFAPGKLERSLEVTARLTQIAERVGCTPSQLALAWLLAKPGVTSPIVGTRNARHIVEDAGAAEVTLDASTVAETDLLIPLGPSQAAT